MRKRKAQNLVNCESSTAESTVFNALQQTNYKWSRQATWGWRIFDFWNHTLGIAVEVDGPEHDSIHDAENDAKNWKTSRIKVLRIRNYNSEDLQKVLDEINKSDTWNKRRTEAGLKLIRMPKGN
jgi:very-short-patch-repair endonuclease